MVEGSSPSFGVPFFAPEEKTKKEKKIRPNGDYVHTYDGECVRHIESFSKRTAGSGAKVLSWSRERKCAYIESKLPRTLQERSYFR